VGFIAASPAPTRRVRACRSPRRLPTAPSRHSDRQARPTEQALLVTPSTTGGLHCGHGRPLTYWTHASGHPAEDRRAPLRPPDLPLDAVAVCGHSADDRRAPLRHPPVHAERQEMHRHPISGGSIAGRILYSERLNLMVTLVVGGLHCGLLIGSVAGAIDVATPSTTSGLYCTCHPLAIRLLP
jgi:hypothetical protein